MLKFQFKLRKFFASDRRSGISVVEVFIVIALMSLLFGLGSVVYSSFSRRDRLDSEIKKLVAIINEAQVKTISGFSLGSEEAWNFGIFFDQGYYVLFPGVAYSPSEVANQKFLLSSGVTIEEIGFSGQVLIFEKISGQVRNFQLGQDYVELVDQSLSGVRRLTISQLGVVRIGR